MMMMIMTMKLFFSIYDRHPPHSLDSGSELMPWRWVFDDDEIVFFGILHPHCTERGLDLRPSPV